MTPEKREELTKHLAGQGLFVLQTRDFDSILMQLARLAQFERLMISYSEGEKTGLVRDLIKVAHVVTDHADNPSDCRPLECVDIPSILADVNRELQAQMDRGAYIDHSTIHAATVAFSGILFKR